MKVGVLALQGSVEEHIRMLGLIDNISPVKIRDANDLEGISGLIIPGGESTTIGKLLTDFKVKESLKREITAGLPVWGTCAGMILLAKEIISENTVHLGVMDVAVRRNAYGSQLQSFSIKTVLPKFADEELPLVFIRGPWIEKVWGECEILASLNDRIIAVRQRNMLATSFHPELTNNLFFHSYFCRMVEESTYKQIK